MLDNFFKISKQEQTTLHKMLRAGMGWIMGGGRTPNDSEAVQGEDGREP